MLASENAATRLRVCDAQIVGRVSALGRAFAGVWHECRDTGRAVALRVLRCSVTGSQKKRIASACASGTSIPMSRRKSGAVAISARNCFLKRTRRRQIAGSRKIEALHGVAAFNTSTIAIMAYCLSTRCLARIDPETGIVRQQLCSLFG